MDLQQTSPQKLYVRCILVPTKQSWKMKIEQDFQTSKNTVVKMNRLIKHKHSTFLIWAAWSFKTILSKGNPTAPHDCFWYLFWTSIVGSYNMYGPGTALEYIIVAETLKQSLQCQITLHASFDSEF